MLRVPELFGFAPGSPHAGVAVRLHSPYSEGQVLYYGPLELALTKDFFADIGDRQFLCQGQPHIYRPETSKVVVEEGGTRVRWDLELASAGSLEPAPEAQQDDPGMQVDATLRATITLTPSSMQQVVVGITEPTNPLRVVVATTSIPEDSVVEAGLEENIVHPFEAALPKLPTSGNNAVLNRSCWGSIGKRARRELGYYLEMKAASTTLEAMQDTSNKAGNFVRWLQLNKEALDAGRSAAAEVARSMQESIRDIHPQPWFRGNLEPWEELKLDAAFADYWTTSCYI